MKREILFRGKRVDNGKWIYGDFLTSNGTECEISDWNEVDYSRHDVDPETVGQFTGETDSNGSLIFDGHIISDDTGIKYIVFWDDKGQWFASDEFGETELLSDIITDTTNIIGNIHDNPDLLK